MLRSDIHETQVKVTCTSSGEVGKKRTNELIDVTRVELKLYVHLGSHQSCWTVGGTKVEEEQSIALLSSLLAPHELFAGLGLPGQARELEAESAVPTVQTL